jgi:peptidoglycan/LPS O-acetylase OafA/YrhL
MKSLNSKYSPGIDQLRWLAASLVFLFHFYSQYRNTGGAAIESVWLGIITEGHTGVALFFTLSGFLFMQIAMRSNSWISYGEFIRNRFLRIFPLFLTIFMVALSISRDTFQAQDILYLFSTNLGHSPTGVSVVTGAAWCISLEFMFYLVFPFLSRFALERGMGYLLKLLAMMLFFKLIVYSENEHSTMMYFSTFVGRFDQFLIGMLAAMSLRRQRTLVHRHGAWLMPLAAILVISDSALQSHLAAFNVTPKAPFWIVWSMLESAGWACFIVVWTGWDKRLPAWLERSLNHGGKISFSFYLLHMGVVHMLAPWFRAHPLTGNIGIDAMISLVMCYAGVWALATLSYNTIELPFLQMRRTYVDPQAAIAAPIDLSRSQQPER